MSMAKPTKQSIKRLKNSLTSVTMSDMQPNQSQPPQLFPPYQAPNGEPQPYMGTPDPSLPSPQMTNMPPMPPVLQPSAAAKKGLQWGLIIPLIVFTVLTLAIGGFAAWAYAGRQDYKNNSDQKAAIAAELAVKQEADRKDAEFVDREKQPYKTYTTSDSSGSVKITYPKTWSGYVNEDQQSIALVDAYWHPDLVPGTKSATAYALRLEITNKLYADEVRSLDSLVKSGSVKVSPYVPKNVSGVTGVRIQGEITKGKNSTMIILPLRDKSIKLYTESPDFVKDLNDIVLANLTFTP